MLTVKLQASVTPPSVGPTCSGVAVMGLLEACVAAGVGEAGFGVPAAGEVGARYFSMAGSTSGVPCNQKFKATLPKIMLFSTFCG